MDDASPIAKKGRKRGAPERAKELWLAKPGISAKAMIAVLEVEGFTGVSRRNANLWMQAWAREAAGGDGEPAIRDPADVPMALSAYSGLISDAGITLRDCELDQVKDTFQRLLAAADAIGSKIVTSLPDVEVSKATDVMALAGAMGTLAAAAASVQESAAKIIEQRGDGARVINPGSQTQVAPASSPMLRALDAWRKPPEAA